MPGDAERIVSNGTSAGGGLSVLLGASGGIDDYEPYLRALGAAYEWQLVGVNDYKKMLITQMIDYRVERKEIAGTLSAGEIAVSEDLAALFPGYLNGLGLRAADGAELVLEADGNGPFKDYVKSFVVARSASPGSSPADPALVRMMNPMSYIGAGGATSAAYWRIRHGTLDKDTSLAISIILATGLRSEGYSVDFALPWDRPHSVDYDLPELFAWIDDIAR